MLHAHDHEAHDIADEPGKGPGNDQAAQRLAPAGLAEQPGRIGTQPEEHGVPERDDAGIAEHQIDGNGKERGDGDLAGQRQIGGEQQEGEDRGKPEGELEDRPAALPLQPEARVAYAVCCIGHACRHRRPNRPSGRTKRMATSSR